MKQPFFYLLMMAMAVTFFSCGEEVSNDPSETGTDTLTQATPDLPANVIRLAGEAQGTTYHITFLSDDTVTYESNVKSILKHFDWSLSNWQEGSLLRQINNPNETTITLRDTFDYIAQMYYLSDSIYRMTDGAFDPSISPLVNAWGFGFANADEMDESKVAQLRPLVGFHRIEISETKDQSGEYRVTIEKPFPQVELDFNAVAQGFSVDIISDFLEISGIEHYLVEIGGELRCKGYSPSGQQWKVQVDQPNEGNQHDAHTVLQITDKALATSGSYRKVREKDGMKYSHTIDPETGFPVTHRLLSATVIADEAAIADAMATAIMVWGVEKTKAQLQNDQLPPMEVYLIFQTESGELETWQTDGLNAFL